MNEQLDGLGPNGCIGAVHSTGSEFESAIPAIPFARFIHFELRFGLCRVGLAFWIRGIDEWAKSILNAEEDEAMEYHFFARSAAVGTGRLESRPFSERMT